MNRNPLELRDNLSIKYFSIDTSLYQTLEASHLLLSSRYTHCFSLISQSFPFSLNYVILQLASKCFNSNFSRFSFVLWLRCFLERLKCFEFISDSLHIININSVDLKRKTGLVQTQKIQLKRSRNKECLRFDLYLQKSKLNY